MGGSRESVRRIFHPRGAAFWALAAILIISSLTIGFGANAAPAATPLSHTIAKSLPVASHPAAPAGAADSTGLPGQTPAGGTFVDGAALAIHQANARLNLTKQWAAYNATHPTAPALTRTASSIQPATTFSLGTFTGYVNSSEGTRRGLGSVSVSAFSLQGAYCPTSSCATVGTNATGFFTVICPAGQDYVQAAASFRVTNLTFAVCRQGTDIYVGTIYLIQTATLTAAVIGDDPAHEHVAGVEVCASSRDGAIIGSPCGTTNIYGSLNQSLVALPPVPSKVQFSPPFGYLANFTYANSTPGGSVYLGVIYLERLVVVRAELYDEVTKQPINSEESLMVCGSLTSVCQRQGQLAYGGDTVEAFGQPGNDYVVIQALGYVQDTHSIGVVPKLAPGKVFDVGKIYIMPDGEFTLNIGITHNYGTLPAWPTGMAVVTVESLDGYETIGLTPTGNTTAQTTQISGCTYLNDPLYAIFGAAPLRDEIAISPESTATCNPFPTWPIPGSMPVWGNDTVLNLTPHVVLGGSAGIRLNFTPGTYVEGNVTAPAQPKGMAEYQVTAQSTDQPGIGAYAYVYEGSSGFTSPWMCGNRMVQEPGPTLGHTFCVAVPPGPVKLTATAEGFETNYSWAATSELCCNASQEPLALQYANPEKFTTINLTAPGSMFGNVFEANNTTIAVAFGTFQVCSATANPNLGCWTGAIAKNGHFWTPAPIGWDYISVSASGFSPNGVWAYVDPNASVGNITLTPLATVGGQVVDSQGIGLVAASIMECPLASPLASNCQPFGAGLTSTIGQYLGTLEGGWLPWSSYRIVASAAGYTSDWAWVNATAGNFSQVPTLVLQQIGTNTSAASVHSAAHPAAATPTSYGVWVDGRITDAQSGWGLQPTSLQACPTNGGVCTLFIDGANPGGYFNGSVPSGLYNLSVSTEGYYSVSVPFNASGAGFLHLGTISLTPFGFVQGRVVMDPWQSLVVYSGKTPYYYQMLPGAVAVACDTTGNLCGAGIDVDTNGYFNVSAPEGFYDRVQVTGLFAGGGPSAAEGFVSNQSVFNLTGYDLELNESNPIEVPIFGAVVGFVYDNSTYNTTLDRPIMPVRWATVTMVTIGGAGSTVASSASGGGEYIYLVPPDNLSGTIYVTALLVNAYYQESARVTGILPPAGVLFAPPLNLSRYGWINAQLTSSVTGLGAPFTPGSSTFYDHQSGQEYLTNGGSNAYGFLNMSAPVGAKVLFWAGPGYDFNRSVNFTVGVNESATTFINSTSPVEMNGVPLEPWGIVQSAAVNTSILPVATTVIDKTNGLPLPGALVTVASSDGVQLGTSQVTNWFGQFVSDAPVGKKDTLSTQHIAFLTNDSTIVVAPGADISIPTVNMTADGVIAGRVVAFPSGAPIAGAVVTACPANGNNCGTALSNGSGLFWVNAPPGIISVSIVESGYVSNTSIVAKVYSDTWTWIGTQVLNEFAEVFGVVRGLPSGLPVEGATVSTCSPLGTPTGPCGFFVTTAASGNFLLATPPGTYILAANDTNYNSTYLPIALAPGQTVNVGVLFLPQFGSLVGNVVSAQSLGYINGAGVIACADWTGGPCLPETNTTGSGDFALHGPPGPYTLSISALGYADAFVPATIVSGITTTLITIQLQPLSTALSYGVSGSVVGTATATPIALAGAVITAWENDTPAFSTVTDASGAFSFAVLYGTYTLEVADPGWMPAYMPLVVHGTVGGIAVTLSPMTYPVAGLVTDGLTGVALAGVLIQEGGSTIGVSDSNGFYSVALTNGTHTLEAVSTSSSGGVQYAPLPFVVVVNGVGFSRNVTLYPPQSDIFGVVINQMSGLPIADANVVISGQTVEGVPIHPIVVLSNAAGNFSTVLPQGAYTVSVSHAGFANNSATVSPGAVPAPTPVTVALAPLATSPSSSSGSAMSSMAQLWAVVLVAAVVGVAVGLAVYVSRKRSRKDSLARPKGSSGRGST